MKKQSKNNVVENLEALKGQEVTPEAPASPEAIEALVKGAKTIEGNAIPEKKGYPLFEDDKAQRPMGDRNGYYCSAPIYICRRVQGRADFISGFLKMSFFGEEAPKIGVCLTVEAQDPFTGKVEERTQWKNYSLDQDQEGFWSQLTTSKEALAFVSSLIHNNELEEIKPHSNRR